MTARRVLRLTHLVSTIWFVVCVSYILVLKLRELRFDWWLIFSLSGTSVVVAFVLVSLYLFALFRGVAGVQQIQMEHPFTGTHYYMGFYVAAPLLGGLAGVFGMLGVGEIGRFTLGVALATLGTTFCVWVVLDPLAGLVETLLPASRKHRAERLAQAEAERRARQHKRKMLIDQALTREDRERERWRQILQPQALRLAGLLTDEAPNSSSVEREAVEIGAEAWRLGGLNCMRQLHEMTLAITQDKQGRTQADDYIAYWWDGIGEWRRPSLE
jgi:hypothetical protein